MVPERADVPSENYWKVESLYASFEDWEKDLEKAGPILWEDLQKYQGKLEENPDFVAYTLKTYFEIDRFLSKLHTYAHLRQDEDLSKEEPKKAYFRISSLYVKFITQSSWINPELLQMSEEKFSTLLEKEAMQEYATYLSRLQRRKRYTLSEKEERLLSLSTKPLHMFQRTFSSLSEVDMNFAPAEDSWGNKHELTSGTCSLYLKSPDRKLRKTAYENLHAGYENLKNTFCNLLKAEMEAQVFEAWARGYKSTLEASLQPKNIDLSVYTSLVKGVHQKLTALQRYLALKKRLLKIEDLRPYDLYVPLVKSVDKNWEYDKAVDLVIESVAPLGQEYQEILSKGLKVEGWADIYENQNKRSGAYSSGCYDSHPFLLLNYHGTFTDLMTLSHEAGHSMHTYLSQTHQPYIYADYPIFVAEVASTFHEQLLFHRLLKKETDPKMRAYLLNYALEHIRTTLFRQTLFAEFEKMLHEWVEEEYPLTPEFLQKEYLALNRKYYGENLVLEEHDALSMEWARIPHFYNGYYVYQYATGISAAIALSQGIFENPEKVSNYLQFLKSGNTKDPLELLQIAGVDLKEPKVVEKALEYFETLLEEFESCMQNLPDEDTSLATES